MSNLLNINDFKSKIDCKGNKYTIFDLNKLFLYLSVDASKVPNTIKILLESILRNAYLGKLKNVDNIVESLINSKIAEIPIFPSNILMEDNAGIPLLLDLATMRNVIKQHGGNPEYVKPILNTNLIVDHSIQADYFKSKDALELNLSKDFERNKERYEFLKWSNDNFKFLNVIPPNSGISHQINLESLSNVLCTNNIDGELIAFPELFIGSDSHTTMINSLGVLGWGAGGIEVEASLLGEPTIIQTPDILGVEITGEINPGVTITDIVLKLTKFLRENQVVGKYLEFFGVGIKNLALPDRATISNMAPEYGAKSALFPIDEETIKYLSLTGRDKELIELISEYSKMQGLSNSNVIYDKKITFDLSKVIAGISGPKNPHEYTPLTEVKESLTNQVFNMKNANKAKYNTNLVNKECEIKDGAVVIAAITSCTNTSNPINMITAGLLAKKAVEYGLTVPSYIKTSLAPGSRVVYQYLKNSGLMEYLEALGFNVVGFGCSTCAGSGGEINPEVNKAILKDNLITCSILSGNRNFPGRIHSDVKLNYLASPALVVAFAIAGTMNINLYNEKLNETGKAIYLKDIWPTKEEVIAVFREVITPQIFIDEYKEIYKYKDYIHWNELKVNKDSLYEWNQKSSYLKPSPFCDIDNIKSSFNKSIEKARVLVLLGDNVSTDDISPGGRITKNSIAGQYLIQHGVPINEFNTYGARRGNHDVMVRGTFDNEHLENKLLENISGSFTKYFPSGEIMSIFDASINYKKDNTDLLIIAGERYGTGSSRDWAAKGPFLLGVRAVLAESFEEIHRSNLVNSGILPLQFRKGEKWLDLGLKGDEIFTIKDTDKIEVGGEIVIQATSSNGRAIHFRTHVQITSENELTYYKNGGILKYLTRKILLKALPVSR